MAYQYYDFTALRGVDLLANIHVDVIDNSLQCFLEVNLHLNVLGVVFDAKQIGHESVPLDLRWLESRRDRRLGRGGSSAYL